MKVKVVPLNDRVLVRRVEGDSKTRGGIIIPDTAKEKPQEGIVASVGPGKMNDDGNRTAMTVKENDRVLFGKYSGNEIKINEEEYVFLREADILGILE